MEKLMKYNVYKVFSSGRRAKAPMMEFAYRERKGKPNAVEHFNLKIKANFSDKLQKNDFIVIRSDLSQDVLVSAGAVERKKKLNLRNRIILSHMTNKNKIGRFVTGMVLCEQSEWKWQWAALELATNNYIEGVSPLFKSHSAAANWMEEQISSL